MTVGSGRAEETGGWVVTLDVELDDGKMFRVVLSPVQAEAVRSGLTRSIARCDDAACEDPPTERPADGPGIACTNCGLLYRERVSCPRCGRSARQGRA